MFTRRDFARLGTVVLGGLMSAGLAVPGMAYLLDPLRRKAGGGTTQTLTRLSGLKVGVPQSFAVFGERKDAWVKYPREPIGSVWLVRQPEGASPAVVAFSAECPHLGCSITLADGGSKFFCPCHKAEFGLTGDTANTVAPRGMDTLDVELTGDDDPAVVVRFQRFRTQTKEKIPLV